MSLYYHNWLQQANRKSTITLGYTWEDQQCEYFDPANQMFSDIRSWDYLKNGMLFSAMGTSYSPELIEISAQLSKQKPAIIVCSESMSAKKQKTIDFIRTGRTVALSPIVPTLDENYQTCTLLKDFLEIGSN